MPDTPDKLDEKVQAIFSEIAGADRAKWLRGDVPYDLPLHSPLLGS